MKPRKTAPELQERLSSHLHLINQSSAGRLDELRCPQCHQNTVSVWFTNPTEDVYRTWFICNQCNFQTRAQDSGRAPHFSETRRRVDLEERDLAILKNTRFKSPKTKES